MAFSELFITRLHEVYTSHVGRVLSSFKQPKQLSIRINRLVTTADELQTVMKNNGIELQQIPWYSDAFIADVSDSRVLTSLPEYDKGMFYIQNLSSMIPALVLDPQPDDHILDLTAAPGSKTTQIASLMENKGSIIANDISNNRIYKLKANLQRYGVTNTHVKQGAAERFWQHHYEEFDKVLLDAPCSMESIFIEQEPETYEDWSVKEIKHLGRKQQWMLRSAVSACKPGGVIIYSTCTIAPEENEQVIDWILQKDGKKIQLEEISIPHLDLMNGITSFEGKSYNSEVAKTKRVIPSEHMEAFFIAKLRKLPVIPDKSQHDPGSSLDSGSSPE